MTLETLNINWVDLLMVILLVAGVVRGRSRGLSEELLDMFKWLLILVAAGFVYEPVGLLLADSSVFSLLSCYVCVYAMVVIIFKAGFALIKHRVGQKLIGSDVFGGAEFYLGMVAGAFRYGCIIVVALAFLHARYYTPEEVADATKFQEDNFGSVYFPTLCGLQREVFVRSLTGRLVNEYLGAVLIRPTSPEDKGLGGRSSVIKAREQDVHEILDRR